MRVTIIGAGIGGLTLAQALHRAGVEVSVHDRDLRVKATGGYRLHLDDLACEVLRRHLAPDHYQALLASSAPRGSVRRYSCTNHHLHLLATMPSDPGTETLLIGRVPLRILLAHGLGDRLRFGAEYVSHNIRPDGKIVTHFADGSTDVADVLVGVDGARSRVAAALAGRDLSSPVGFGGIAARTPLTTRTRALLPAALDGGPALAFGPNGASVFLTTHDPATGPTVDPNVCTHSGRRHRSTRADLGTQRHRVTAAPRPSRFPDRHRADRARRRHTARLARAAAPTDHRHRPRHRSLVPVLRRRPRRRADPLVSRPVTALGDAVNAMPPTGGRAAATAIRDADHLTRELLAARDGTATIAVATHQFHRHMTGYAPDAVRASLRPLQWLRRLNRPGLRGLAGHGLTAAATAHRLTTTLYARRGAG